MSRAKLVPVAIVILALLGSVGYIVLSKIPIFSFVAPQEDGALVQGVEYKIKWFSNTRMLSHPYASGNTITLVALSERCIEKGKECWEFGNLPRYSAPDFILLDEYVEGSNLVWKAGEYGVNPYETRLAPPGRYRLMAFLSSESPYPEELFLGSVDFEIAGR